MDEMQRSGDRARILAQASLTAGVGLLKAHHTASIQGEDQDFSSLGPAKPDL